MVDASATGNPEGRMPEIDPQSEHQTINSLVTKIVLMVFVGSFASAALVSWATHIGYQGRQGCGLYQE